MTKSIQPNIVLIKYTSTNNIGDFVIFETTKFLVEQLLEKVDTSHNFSISSFDLYKNITQKEEINFALRALSKGLIDHKFLIFRYYKAQIKKWRDRLKVGLKNADAVIFCGGGIIKWSVEFFSLPIACIVHYCDKHKIPVYFNAVGIEGYSRTNMSCILLKWFLNRKCVKKITTRDNLATLQKYVKNKHKIALAGDPALFSRECFGTKLQTGNATIGVGVIREDIFVDYGQRKYNEKFLLSSYINLLETLTNRGYNWKLFCNGIIADYKMGKKILKKLQLPEEEYLLPRPTSSKDLIEIIAQFKAIFSPRLHGNIIATSYDIPCVGLVWNQKVKCFGKILGIENRFIAPEDFNGDYVIEQLEEAITNGCNIDKIEALKQKTKEELARFLVDVI